MRKWIFFVNNRLYVPIIFASFHPTLAFRLFFNKTLLCCNCLYLLILYFISFYETCANDNIHQANCANSNKRRKLVSKGPPPKQWLGLLNVWFAYNRVVKGKIINYCFYMDTFALRLWQTYINRWNSTITGKCILIK